MSIIARRTLQIRSAGGVASFEARVMQPRRAKSIPYVCPIEIDWPGEPWHGEAYGVDEIQALVMALQMIGARLYTSSYHQSGHLVWTEQSKGYGFPVPRNLRDMLVGEDRTFEGP
jgi:hypothetical protein